jgi:hypothetical protein
MSSVGKPIGDVTLRDFKNLFDRPGFFRFHFKSVDQEFGMVKEEVRGPIYLLHTLYGIVTLFLQTVYRSAGLVSKLFELEDPHEKLA